MSAKLPYLPEGSVANETARKWTPHLQQRIALWGKNKPVTLVYPRAASINGGKHNKRMRENGEDQHWIASVAFNICHTNIIKVKIYSETINKHLTS